MTVETFVRSVLRLMNSLGAGEGSTPAPEELADGLEALNNLLNEWRVILPAVHTMDNVTHALTAAQQAYTIGTGGDINRERPVKIKAASIIHTGNTPNLSTPVRIVDVDEWNVILSKNATDVPTSLYFDGDYPLAKIYLHPKPSASQSINLYLWSEITQPLALSDTLDYPPGYRNALRFALALDLSIEWGRPVADDLRKRAAESKAELGGLNLSNLNATDLAKMQPAA